MINQKNLSVEVTRVNRKIADKKFGEMVIYADVRIEEHDLNSIVAKLFELDLEVDGPRKGQVICRDEERLTLKQEIEGSSFLILKELEASLSKSTKKDDKTNPDANTDKTTKTTTKADKTTK